MSWLKLIRWKNLLIIFLTQLLAWWCVILPLKPEILNWFNFLVLSISTLLIAASGYIINDYFDIKIDIINRPQKVVLGKSIKRSTAIIIHTILNFVAILMASYLALKQSNYFLPILQLLCTFLLWYYSTKFKRQYMVGNIVVSFLTALTIMILVFYEPMFLKVVNASFYSNHILQTSIPFWVLIEYAYFAFMLNWIREIVKDIEDIKGDLEEGCNTMPIKMGILYSVKFIRLLVLLVSIPLFVTSFFLFRHHYFLFSGYVFFILGLPIIGWSVMLQNSNSTLHFHRASRGLKIIMVLGVISLIIYYLQSV